MYPSRITHTFINTSFKVSIPVSVSQAPPLLISLQHWALWMTYLPATSSSLCSPSFCTVLLPFPSLWLFLLCLPLWLSLLYPSFHHGFLHWLSPLYSVPSFGKLIPTANCNPFLRIYQHCLGLPCGQVQILTTQWYGVMVKSTGSGARLFCLSSSSATYSLRNLGQVT